MDAQRFDAMARAMAGGATRRRALRLAGGSLAGALLAAAGLGKRAGAQENPDKCREFLERCYERGEAECPRPAPGAPATAFREWHQCLYHRVPGCRAAYATCRFSCELIAGCGQQGCPQDRTCIALVNPVGQLRCQCVEL